MEKMEGYKTLLGQLSTLLDSLENGTLDLNGLSQLEKVTRELHERSIILRYNGFKSAVIGEEAPPESVAERVAEVAEPEVVPEPVVEEVEEPTIDFSIFDAPEITEEPAEEPETAIVEEVPEIFEEEIELVEVASAPAVEELKPAAETPKPMEERQELSASAASFLDSFNKPDDSVASRFALGKLDSLIGAFGLNERLGFINELFEGSSEMFSDAIKTLDSQSSLNEAHRLAAQYAAQFNWDSEEEAVVDFMTYLNRRYA